MESNNSIEELVIRYLQNEIQEDELRVLDAWIHESDANKSHFFELKGLFDTRKEVAFLNHYSVERSWEMYAPHNTYQIICRSRLLRMTSTDATDLLKLWTKK